MDELLTTRQVAVELQVSESSVKRWCDQGMIRTQRTAGGHRRIARSGLNAFLASHAAKGVPLAADAATASARPAGAPPAGAHPVGAHSAGPIAARARPGVESPAAAARQAARVAEALEAYSPTPSRDRLVERFQQALLAGDEGECRRLLAQWSTHYPGLAQFGDSLISRAMERVGQEWECRRAEIFQERRACEICLRLIHELRQRLPAPPPRALRAIGGTLDGDHYALASQLVELVLREAGWNATNLGGDLPLETLLAAVRKERPQLLWLSISHIADPEQFVEEYNAFYSQLSSDLLVAVGGRALTDALRPRIGYTAHCDNLEQLSALAQVISGVR